MERFVCELCEKEHDGSYGSGRFCSDHCRRVYCGRKTQHHVCNFPKGNPKNPPKEGGWKCSHCERVFRTRREMYSHSIEVHHNGKKKNAWNKGLSKETSDIIKKHS